MIPINDDFRVTFDKHNHILEQRTNEKWNSIGFYGSMKGVLKGALKHDLKNATDLADVIRRLDEFEISDHLQETHSE